MSKWYKIIFVISAFIEMSYGHSLCAQTLPVVNERDRNLFNEELLRLRVKQIDEFMRRFNLELDWQGEKIASCYDTVKCKKYIKFLFDQNMRNDSLLEAVIDKFATNVVLNKIKTNYKDNDWYAEVVCKFLYCGKKYDLSLFLKTEHIEDYKYKWVFCGVRSNLLNTTPFNENSKSIISPVDNEMNFMSLGEIFSKDAANIAVYVGKNQQINDLSVFVFLVKNKLIDFVSMEEIKYHFFQVPGYVFTVQHFERKNANMGWLISFILPCDDAGKHLYRMSLFN